MHPLIRQCNFSTACPSRRQHAAFINICFFQSWSYPHVRIWVSDGSTVRGVQVWHVLGSGLDLTGTAELVFSLGGGDTVDDESALHIIDDTEVLAGLLDLDDIHESGWESGVSPELSVDLNETLLADSLNLLHAEGILQAVPEEKSDGKRLSLLVWARAGLDGEDSSKFV